MLKHRLAVQNKAVLGEVWTQLSVRDYLISNVIRVEGNATSSARLTQKHWYRNEGDHFEFLSISQVLYTKLR